MNILITICARGGSKGVPNKNIKEVGGLPLIAYSINTARKFKEHFHDFGVDIELSTESESIKEIVSQFGLSTDYTRPALLANDDAGKIETIEHIWKYAENTYYKKYEFVIDLDVSSPLRTVEDLVRAFERIRADPSALSLISISESNKNPYFNMVELKEDGYGKLVKPLTNPIFSRQTAPKVYDINGSFYFFRRAFFEHGFRSPTTERSLMHLIDHVCFDIDTLLDFEILSFLIKEKKLGFDFGG